jgi:hypothetical protein
LAVCVVGSAPAAPRDGEAIQIERLGCQGVRVVARDVRADAVLAKLAATLDFQVSGIEALAGNVNISSVVPLAKVVAAVLPGRNVIVSYRRDDSCRGQWKVARAWVLQQGTPAALPHLPAIAAIPVTKEAREQDELYQRAHGMMPPLEESAPAGR